MDNELNSIKERIEFLIRNYRKLSLLTNKTLQDFRDIQECFEELISYHKTPDFDNLFFEYFNQYSLNDSSDDSSNLVELSDDYSNLVELQEELSDDTIDKKRKASSSPTFSGFSEDSDDSHLDDLFSSYN
jgi:hypothetical protein